MNGNENNTNNNEVAMKTNTARTAKESKMKTIHRNNKRLKTLADSVSRLTVHTLDNGFKNEDLSLSNVPQLIEWCIGNKNCRISGNDSQVMFKIHSRLWYRVEISA